MVFVGFDFIVPTVHGNVLVIGNQKAVVGIRWTDDPISIASDGEPGARISSSICSQDFSQRVVQWMRSAATCSFNFPFELDGTDFQVSVWKEIMNIPFGETITYSELARRVGKPTASRAVASACAKNELAMLVPCHRVVPLSAGVGKYRWGEDRKKKLLEWEKEMVASHLLTWTQ